MNIGGSVTRPVGSDSFPPPVGTVVSWHLSTPIQALYDQAKAAGITILGTIGNSEHLKKHGDHTPWAAGKPGGWIWAIDLDMPDDFGPWLVSKCKSDYDTLWIDFFNFRGRQYDNAGTDLGSNADNHFHCSVRGNKGSVTPSLISDYAKAKGLNMDAFDPNITGVVQPDDITGPNAPGFSRPLSWWVGAIYQHVVSGVEKPLGTFITNAGVVFKGIKTTVDTINGKMDEIPRSADIQSIVHQELTANPAAVTLSDTDKADIAHRVVVQLIGAVVPPTTK